MEPAVLGRDFKHVEVTVLNAYAWAGNTTFSRYKIEQIVQAQIPDITEIVSNLKKKNRVGLGATVDILHVGVRLNRKGEVKSHKHQNKVWCPGDFFMEELGTISFGVSDRVEANLTYAGDIFRLAWQGNKQFEGEKADLSIKANAFYAREWAVGGAIPLPIYYDKRIWRDFDFRAGIRVKYIQGLGAAYTQRSDNSLYTAPDGRYVSLDYDYAVHYSDYESFNPFKAQGRGIGTDIGLSAHYKTRFYGNINLLDLAYVKFKGNTTSYTSSGSAQFDGVYTGSLFDTTFSFDDSEYRPIYENAESKGDGFRMPYPTRLRTHLSYRIPATNRQDEMYHKHSLSLTYIQGFRDFGNATTSPYFAGAYAFNLWDHFEMGTNLGFSGFNKVEIGAFFAARIHFFRIGLGSGNITPLIKKFGTGGDINFNISLSF